MRTIGHHRADAQVIKAGAETVEAEWPLELARLTFPAMPKDAVEGGQQDGAPLVGPVGGMSLSSAPATPDDLDWLLETSGATALILLEVRPPHCTLQFAAGSDAATLSATVCCQRCGATPWCQK